MFDIFLLLIALSGQPKIDQVPTVTLPKITIDCSEEETIRYKAKIISIVENSKDLDAMSLWNLKVLLMSISYIPFKDKFSKEDLQDLRRFETKLVGLIIQSLKVRINPSVNISDLKLYFASYPPYDVAYPDPTDRADVRKRNQYNTTVDSKLKSLRIITEQIEIKRCLDSCLKISKHFLHNMYVDNRDQEEEVSSLDDSGLDQKTVESLIQP